MTREFRHNNPDAYKDERTYAQGRHAPDTLDPDVDIDAIARAAMLPDQDFSETGAPGMSLREARFASARVAGLNYTDSVRFADGDPGMPEGTAARKSMVLQKQARGAIEHVKKRIALIATELMVDGIDVKAMANLAVSTFAEVAANASGTEKTADRLTAASHLAKISGLYAAGASDAPEITKGEEEIRGDIIKKLNALLGARKSKGGGLEKMIEGEAPKADDAPLVEGG